VWHNLAAATYAAAMQTAFRGLVISVLLGLVASSCTDAAQTASTSATGGAATPATEQANTVLTTTAPSTTSAPATAAPTTLPARPNLRGDRYCEVLLIKPIDGKPNAEVYNTYPLNDCPAAQWKALDPAAIAQEYGVPLAVLNGPRYWLMDSIEPPTGEAPAPVSFGGMQMIQRATVDLASVGAGEPPYTAHHVNRRTVFGFDAGSTVYELVAADGAVYVMQSWSQQVDPALDEIGLATLADRLQLPAGWSFRVRTLTEPLDIVTTDTDAVVLQDELKNSYSLEAAV